MIVVKYALVDCYDLDILVLEGITEDDTADTTCALTPQISSSSVTSTVSRQKTIMMLTKTVTSTNDSTSRLRILYDNMKES